MEYVSFKVAKAIKKAGYPQGQEEHAYRSNGEIYIFEDMFDHIPDYCCDAPTYMEVWLWLWREKRICINCKLDKYNLLPMWWCTNEDDINYNTPNFNDPEEAIIAAIEYLVENDLIK